MPIILQTNAFAAAPAAARPVWTSLKRGFFGRCPACGEGKIFRAYLKVNDSCPACRENLSHQRADDAPPYITMLITGHVMVAAYMIVDDTWPNGAMLPQVIFFCLLTAAVSLALLPRVKGALIGYQWALRMHGFGGPDVEHPGVAAELGLGIK